MINHMVDKFVSSFEKPRVTYETKCTIAGAFLFICTFLSLIFFIFSVGALKGDVNALKKDAIAQADRIQSLERELDDQFFLLNGHVDNVDGKLLDQQHRIDQLKNVKIQAVGKAVNKKRTRRGR